MNDKVKYWLELSEYDFETAEAMLSSKRYLYVGFMCHQTIEKILKAYFTSFKEKCEILISKTNILQKWIKLRL
ncbi:hypothetical protein MASR2M47_06000 [Draconibacterium sp.]